jgi:hypothetical protein
MGTIQENRILIDGDWELQDLYEFSKAYSQVYSFIYSLSASLNADDLEKLALTYKSYPWRGGYSAVNFYNYLSNLVPHAHRPKIISIRYESPGWIELGLILSVAVSIRTVIKLFVKSAKELHDVYNEIHEGLQKRKLLKLEVKSKELELTKEQLKFVENSLQSLSNLMGFQNVETINSLTKNPLATLKILLSYYRRVRKLSDYEDNSKLKF